MIRREQLHADDPLQVLPHLCEGHLYDQPSCMWHLDPRRGKVVKAVAKSVGHLSWVEGAVEVLVAKQHRREQDDLLVPRQGTTLADGFQGQQLLLREYRGGSRELGAGVGVIDLRGPL